MAPSSSGLGRLVLIQKIAGSTPAGVTRVIKMPVRAIFVTLVVSVGNEFVKRVRTEASVSERRFFLPQKINCERKAHRACPVGDGLEMH